MNEPRLTSCVSLLVSKILACLLLPVYLMACDSPSQSGSPIPDQARTDLHSYANSDVVRVTHVELDLDVSFEDQELRGSAMLSFDRLSSPADTLVVDTRDLVIVAVETWSGSGGFLAATYGLGESDAVLGAPLRIVLPSDATRVRIRYRTNPSASALQWLSPLQTAGKNHPFMFTQSQAIHARSWIPLQDSPGVRVTYGARIRTPEGLRAVMSAANDPYESVDGDYRFDMQQPIPSYLIALAVGDLAFESLSNRAGVFAEPSLIQSASEEFSDTEDMITATERLYGPYRWNRYDILVLPPSFPFGGMENPRLTFATPTILAGDKSLVSLVAHELAHSWAGNLVSNATWRDFWLNEGITTYIERRILEEVYGRHRQEMESVLGWQLLHDELARLEDSDEILHVDLSGRDPDEGMTQIPYEKGSLLLSHLEKVVGRERFDLFLRDYFDHFSFESITTSDFVEYLQESLLGNDVSASEQVPIQQWIEQPGLPAGVPEPEFGVFQQVEREADSWLTGSVSAASLKSGQWSTQEWLRFLKVLPEEISDSRLTDLDAAFGFTASGNAEIVHQWLLIAIRNSYRQVDDRLEEYLVNVGRRKLVVPLYEALAVTEAGRSRALGIYGRARQGYHPITISAVDLILGQPQ